MKRFLSIAFVLCFAGVVDAGQLADFRIYDDGVLVPESNFTITYSMMYTYDRSITLSGNTDHFNILAEGAIQLSSPTITTYIEAKNTSAGAHTLTVMYSAVEVKAYFPHDYLILHNYNGDHATAYASLSNELFNLQFAATTETTPVYPHHGYTDPPLSLTTEVDIALSGGQADLGDGSLGWLSAGFGTPPPQVPEPGTIGLFGVGVAALLIMRKVRSVCCVIRGSM